jgi:glyoxylase I family protein
MGFANNRLNLGQLQKPQGNQQNDGLILLFYLGEKMLFSGIHHVAIICSNYEVSKHFYTKILKLNIIHEAYRQDRKSYKLDLQLPDGTQLELFSFESPPQRVSRPEACGLRHLAFRVENLVEVRNYLEENGIPCEPIKTDEYTGRRFTFFADPDDLPLELYEDV